MSVPEKRKRGQNFAIEEKEKLVKLIALQKDTILNKKTDGCTNEAKMKAWIEVTNAFNSSGTVYRAKDSLIKVWEKLKTESKLYYQSSRRNVFGTGGGPSEIKTDPILEQVCALLGRGCTGIIGILDSDALEMPSSVPLQIDLLPLEEQVEEPIIEIVSENKENVQENFSISKTPLWSRRRPKLPQTNERSEAVSSLCASFTNVNKKKEDFEELRRQLLDDELNFKRRLYQLQLESAAKDVEIKTAVLNHIKNGVGLQSWFDSQADKAKYN